MTKDKDSKKVNTLNLKFIGTVSTSIFGLGILVPNQELEMSLSEYNLKLKHTGLFKILKD